MMVPFGFMVIYQKNTQSQVGFCVSVINLRCSFKNANCIMELVKWKSNQDFLGQEKLVPLGNAPEGALKEEKYELTVLQSVIRREHSS